MSTEEYLSWEKLLSNAGFQYPGDVPHNATSILVAIGAISRKPSKNKYITSKKYKVANDLLWEEIVRSLKRNGYK